MSCCFGGSSLELFPECKDSYFFLQKKTKKKKKNNTFVIKKTCLYNFDPLKPNFYIVKPGFIGVYISFFLFLLENIHCEYSLEPPRRGGSNEYHNLCRNMKKVSEIFLSENFQFWRWNFYIFEYACFRNVLNIYEIHVVQMSRKSHNHRTQSTNDTNRKR